MEHGGPDRELKHSTGNIDFSVNVLTMGNWPSYEYMEVNIPPDLAEYGELFKQVLFARNLCHYFCTRYFCVINFF